MMSRTNLVKNPNVLVMFYGVRHYVAPFINNFMTCKNCDHSCHCSNGGSCQSCDCKNCECK